MSEFETKADILDRLARTPVEDVKVGEGQDWLDAQKPRLPDRPLTRVNALAYKGPVFSVPTDEFGNSYPRPPIQPTRLRLQLTRLASFITIMID